jgi:DNA-binding transcriptional MerR regulator
MPNEITLDTPLGAAQVRRLVELTEGRRLSNQLLDYYHKTGMVVPSVREYGDSTGDRRRLWSVGDVVVLRWLCRLKNQGLPVYRFRKGLAYLREHLPEVMDNPEKMVFATDGERFAWWNSDSVAYVDLVENPGQLYLLFPAGEVTTETLKAAEKLVQAA